MYLATDLSYGGIKYDAPCGSIMNSVWNIQVNLSGLQWMHT